MKGCRWRTYMERSVGADESKGIAHHTDHEGHTLTGPASIVDKDSKDV